MGFGRVLVVFCGLPKPRRSSNTKALTVANADPDPDGPFGLKERLIARKGAQKGTYGKGTYGIMGPNVEW